MKKKLLMVLISVSMIASVFTGCGNSTEAKDSGKAQTEQADTKEDSADKADGEQAALEDGTYTAEFQTDSSMFHVNEAMDGKGTLTVEDGKMTIHISLVSKNIVNLFEGTAEDAQKDGAELLQLQQILLITAMEHLMRSMDSTFRFRHWTKNLILL